MLGDVQMILREDDKTLDNITGNCSILSFFRKSYILDHVQMDFLKVTNDWSTPCTSRRLENNNCKAKDIPDILYGI
ncbi:hypothetical protein TNCT_347891 [Trichonephila clavata]|uniref:Uncharacterized protein n=1 Tax=Trichonephila clavata TaxID=2740835 RepID=A0A8X6M3C2_TRICU|nr:hypothetical protein TNCT_347891 [Trichonephila clavata]